MNAEHLPLSVMLVDECSERVDMLDATLSAIGYNVVARVSATGNLHAAFERYRPDIIVIDMESPDRDTLESMRSISDEDPRPIVMFTNDDCQASIRRAVRSGVSAYVTDGISAHRVRPVLDAAIARFEEYQALRKELAQTRASLADRKVIDQAKGLLMRKKKLDEPAAYRAMQKMAMDRNLRLADLARSIIAASELLG